MLMMQMMMNQQNNKPKRTYKRKSSYSKYDKRILKDAKRTGRKWPRRHFGRAFIERGTQGSINEFGTSYGAATDQQKANRKNMGFRGKGKYSFWDTVGHVAEDVGTAALIAGVGNYGTSHTGDTISGSGVYQDHAKNQLFVQSGKNTATRFFSPNNEQGSLTVSKREWIGNVLAPPLVDPSHDASATNPCIPFFAQQLRVNPGDMHMFPWLSQIAKNFTEYSFLQLVFEFESGVDAANSETGNTGSICLVPTYNPSAEALLNETAFMGESEAVTCRLTENALCGVECDPRKGVKFPKFVTSGSYVSDVANDIDDYDASVLQWSINGCPGVFANQNIGKLFVTYTCNLTKPRLFDTLGMSVICDTWCSKALWYMPEGSNGTPYDGIAPPGTSLTADGNTNYNPPRGFLENSESYVSGSLVLHGINNKLDIVLKPVFIKDDTSSAWYRGGMAFLFPEWVQGDFKIMIRLTRGNPDDHENSTDIISPKYDFDKYDADPGGFTSGNIQLISDMTAGDYPGTKMSWICCTVQNQPTGADEQSFNYEMHIRVAKATSGIQNIAFVPMLYSGVNSNAAGAVDISVQQYNPQAYKPNMGGNGIHMLDEYGVRTTPFFA